VVVVFVDTLASSSSTSLMKRRLRLLSLSLYLSDVIINCIDFVARCYLLIFFIFSDGAKVHFCATQCDVLFRVRSLVTLKEDWNCRKLRQNYLCVKVAFFFTKNKIEVVVNIFLSCYASSMEARKKVAFFDL